MRDRRRMLLSQLGGASFAIPSFDGSHAVFGDEKKGYIECYSTGTITFPAAGKVDICIVGGGSKSATSPSGTTSGSTSTIKSSAGGDGGKINTVFGYSVAKGEACSVQVGSAASDSTFASLSSANGSVKANGGAQTTYSGSSAPSPVYFKGKNGEDAPHIFDDASFPQYGAGGGAGALAWQVPTTTAAGGTGGTTGGGNGVSLTKSSPYYTAGTDGAANTGGGGGGIAYVKGSGNRGTATSGGSGIVVIRWGYKRSA